VREAISEAVSEREPLFLDENLEALNERGGGGENEGEGEERTREKCK
jgi:hypothetical protein